MIEEGMESLVGKLRVWRVTESCHEDVANFPRWLFSLSTENGSFVYCVAPEELVEEMLGYDAKAVTVAGWVERGRDGEPLFVQAAQIELVS